MKYRKKKRKGSQFSDLVCLDRFMIMKLQLCGTKAHRGGNIVQRQIPSGKIPLIVCQLLKSHIFRCTHPSILILNILT